MKQARRGEIVELSFFMSFSRVGPIQMFHKKFRRKLLFVLFRDVFDGFLPAAES